MATFEIEIDDEKIHELLQGDQGMAVLLEPILNQILQAEMTEHLKAEPGEQTSGRRGYRNGSYERQLTTRVGRIELEVPRDREGTFFGSSLPALSAEREGACTDAHADGRAGSLCQSSQGDHHRTLRTRVQQVDGISFGSEP
nr:transposase [Salinibacter altiplanensis]